MRLGCHVLLLFLAVGAVLCTVAPCGNGLPCGGRDRDGQKDEGCCPEARREQSGRRDRQTETTTIPDSVTVYPRAVSASWS